MAARCKEGTVGQRRWRAPIECPKLVPRFCSIEHPDCQGHVIYRDSECSVCCRGCWEHRSWTARGTVTIDDMLILETDPRREMGTIPGSKCCFKSGPSMVCASSQVRESPSVDRHIGPERTSGRPSVREKCPGSVHTSNHVRTCESLRQAPIRCSDR